MKHLFLLFILLNLSFLSAERIQAKVADTKQIELKGQAHDERPRSVFPVAAQLDGTNLCISFLNHPQEATIKVTDSNGVIVKEVIVASPLQVQFPIEKRPGLLKIEIVYTGTYLSGMFEM